jgi:hypothetical protein
MNKVFVFAATRSWFGRVPFKALIYRFLLIEHG